MATSAAEFDDAKRGKRLFAIGTMIDDAFSKRAPSRSPKYLSLHAALSSLVERGGLQPGEQLPSDDDISARLRLSVGTVQKAMNALRDDGLLERRQGAGTFVVDPSIDVHDLWHFRFVDADGGGFLPVAAKAMQRRLIRKSGPWQAHMPKTQRFLAVTRRLRVDTAFYVLSDFYFDGDRFGELADEPLKFFDRVVLRNILVERFNVRTKDAKQLLVCAPMTARDSRMVMVAPDQNGMVLETFGSDQNDQPIFYQRIVIPPTMHKLAVADAS